jgi:hypothetical protein
MGLRDGKTRLTVETDDKVGVVYELSSVFADHGLSIDSLVTCRQPNGKYEIVIRGDIPDARNHQAGNRSQGLSCHPYGKDWWLSLVFQDTLSGFVWSGWGYFLWNPFKNLWFLCYAYFRVFMWKNEIVCILIARLLVHAWRQHQ